MVSAADQRKTPRIMARITQSSGMGKGNITASEAEVVQFFLVTEYFKQTLDVQLLSNPLYDGVQKAYIIVFYVFIGIGSLVSLYRWFRMYRVQQVFVLDATVLIQAIIEIFDTFSDLFFYLNGFFGIFWFILYCINQEEFNQPDLVYFWVLTILGTVFKTIVICYNVGKQSTSDVFFIDWERSKGLLQAEGTGHVVPAKPSVFRHLRICDKWKELSTKRSTNVTFSCLMTALVLNLCPELHLEYAYLRFSEQQPFVRFGFIAVLYLFFAGFQFIVSAVYHHFFKHPARDFVEELCLSNISMFLLDSQYHGYYVHGETVHQCADTDMLTLLKNVQKEKENKVPPRGMFPNDNCVTFEMYLKRDVRQAFDENYSSAINKLAVGLPTAQLNPSVVEQQVADAVQASEQINAYFMSWIKNCREAQSIIKAQKSPLEKSFRMPPSMNQAPYSVFYRDDSDTSFSSNVLMGLEWDLVFFEIFWFAVSDYWFTNTSIASALFTWFMSTLVSIGRRIIGTRNVGTKTLTDKRLL
eukprot:MONOS_12783.1-p1 / transcript=MONOS_12783.1 / gene=MONOS_12783 / organism=Monocercomonoides_exilis_PA203 / gene_product=Meckelin / transcript_product=Meckelin / location=Mono_scaffold00732:24129-27395(-) / protein_length=526 / sequence_SO=supercontig / SO=protein_coding / is_pseudo=false